MKLKVSTERLRIGSDMPCRKLLKRGQLRETADCPAVVMVFCLFLAVCGCEGVERRQAADMPAESGAADTLTS